MEGVVRTGNYASALFLVRAREVSAALRELRFTELYGFVGMI